jgi:class 3 adenylate cyclase/predicted ATPase
VNEIADWLKKLGLGQYAQQFVENDINFSVLPDLTDQDLKELGVGSLGHRRMLQRAIADLNTGERPKAAPIGGVPPRQDTAERRQVTVMFCDLVGSTALAASMDPEDLREVISAYQKCAAETVRRCDGFVAKYMGDGVLVYFGYPQAHEDDAERAVRAGLELISALSALKTGRSLQTRIGIATGLVVVGDLIGSGEAQERGIVGETPNLAARLQGLAEPNTVVISEATRRLVGNLFEFKDLGPKELKGIAEPARVWMALRQSSMESRFEALRVSGLTPLVGREEELDLLLRRWSKAQTGEGQVVLLSGEAGLGKSRLVATLHERLRQDPHTHLRYFCSPHSIDSALHPTILQLERAANFERDDPASARLKKLEALLASDAASTNDIPLVAELLSIPTDAGYTAINVPPLRKKQMIFEALLGRLAALSHAQQIFIMYEDVHWLDPTSRELLDLTVNRVARLPILLLITYRPEFQPAWVGQPHVTSLVLNRLGRREGASMVKSLAGNFALPQETVSEIIDRTDGIPLFLEEMTKAVIEAGTNVSTVARTALAVPATLHASLMARLDRLGTSVKEVAQIASTIGREFSYELLSVVADRSDDILVNALDQLIEAGLVFGRGNPPAATYLFKHALVQDCAYGTLLRARRQKLHADVARAIESHLPNRAEIQPELIAHHLTEGKRTEPAIRAWLKAGRKSFARSGMIEAVTQLRKGLDLTDNLPECHDRWRLELELQLALGGALFGGKGGFAPETGRAYSRARELCGRLGDTTALMSVLGGQSPYHYMRCEYRPAREAAENLLTMAETHNNPSGVVNGHRNAGICSWGVGEHVSAKRHFEQVLSIYDPGTMRSSLSGSPFEPRAHALSLLSLTLLLLGYPDQALARYNEGLFLSRSLGHTYTLHATLIFSGLLHVLLRDERATLSAVEEGVSVAAEQGSPHLLAWAKIMRGHLTAMRGNGKEGIELAHKGLSEISAMGATIFRTVFLSVIAETCERLARAAEAREMLRSALEMANTTGERVMEPELHRLLGEDVRLHVPEDWHAAEMCFRRALDVAREQQAKFWELRAAMSMARLWRDQGKRHQARDLLAPVYGWFTEGFDTLDLKEAKALLSDLSS